MPPSGFILLNTARSAIDWVKVHGRLHGRHLLSVFYMLFDGFVWKCADEIGFPIPLHPRRIETIEHALQYRMGNRAGQVECRRLEIPDRLKHLLRLLHRSRVAPYDAAHLFIVQMLGKRWPWGYAVESKEAIDVIRCLRHETAVPAHHLCRVFHRPQHRSAVVGAHALRLEQKRSHDAKVASPAPD